MHAILLTSKVAAAASFPFINKIEVIDRFLSINGFMIMGHKTSIVNLLNEFTCIQLECTMDILTIHAYIKQMSAQMFE